MTEKKKKGLWAEVWLVLSVAVPVLGGAAVAPLLAMARDATPPKTKPPLEPWQTEQFWLFVLAGTVLLIAAVVGIVAKVLDSRKKGKLEGIIDGQAVMLASAKDTQNSAVASAKLDQLVLVHDELIPVAASIADMARYPLESRGPYLKNVAQAAATALEKLVSEHVQRPRAVIYSLDADADPVSMSTLR